MIWISRRWIYDDKEKNVDYRDAVRKKKEVGTSQKRLTTYKKDTWSSNLNNALMVTCGRDVNKQNYSGSLALKTNFWNSYKYGRSFIRFSIHNLPIYAENGIE